MYKKIAKILYKIFTPATVYKYFFSISPMYRRSTGKIKYVSKNLDTINIEIPLSYKNKNYADSIFGGSLFSATDPIYMMQLIKILGDSYIIWDKYSSIHYIRPAKENAYSSFIFSKEEIDNIKSGIRKNGEIVWDKKLSITDKNGGIFCFLEKKIYIADKFFYNRKINNHHISMN